MPEVFFHNYINDRVPVFFGSFFMENALYHDYETRHCHHICIPHSRTTKARKCIRYHIPMLLNTLPLQKLPNDTLIAKSDL